MQNDDSDDEDFEDQEDDDDYATNALKQRNAEINLLRQSGRFIEAYLCNNAALEFLQNVQTMSALNCGKRVKDDAIKELLEAINDDRDLVGEVVSLLDKQGYKLPKIEASPHSDKAKVMPKLTEVVQSALGVLEPSLVVNFPVATNTVFNSLDPPSDTLTPEQALDWCRSRFIFALVNKKFRLVDLKYFDPVTEMLCLEPYDVTELNRFFGWCSVAIPITNKAGKPDFILRKVIDYFEANEKRRYEQIVFSPGGTLPPNIFNTWKGYAVTPLAGSWAKLDRHILEVLCDNDQGHYQYFLDLLANLVQLDQKPGVAIVLVGKKGTGKSLAVSYIGRIFGRHYAQLTKRDHLLGRFNSNLIDKLLIFLDEGFWGGDKVAEGALKGLITEDQLTVEAKFENVKSVVNHIRIVMASNEDWVIPTSHDERRYFVLRVSDKWIGNYKYFEELAYEMEGDGPAAMLHDLLKRKYDIKKLRSAPRSSEYASQTFQSDPVFRFLVKCIDRSSLLDPAMNGGVLAWGAVVKDDLHKEFQMFRNCEGQKHPENKVNFGRKLKEWLPMIGTTKINGMPAHNFPQIEECKTAIEAVLKTPWHWN